MKRKERNHTNKRQSFRTRRREAESPIRDLPEEVWDVQQRPIEGELILVAPISDLFLSFSFNKEKGLLRELGCN